MADQKKPEQKTGFDGELDNILTPAHSSAQPSLMRDKKSESRFRPRYPEIHFTSSLYIDDAVEHLQKQILEANNRMDTLIIRGFVSRVDEDRARFEINAIRMGFTTVCFVGTMQRWQGDKTRVDVDIQYSPKSVKVSGKKRYSTSDRVAILFIVLCVLTSLVGLIMTITRQSGAPILLFVTLILFIIIGGLSEASKDVHGHEQVASPSLVGHDTDELTAVLNAVFSDYDMQWLK